MTNFIKENFDTFGGYVTYGTDNISRNRKFVARFKYAKDGMGSFLTFLRKNFTVEEYFSRLDGGEAPLKILQSKGYLQPHIKKWLKEAGYEVSVAGFDQYVKDSVSRRKAA